MATTSSKAPTNDNDELKESASSQRLGEFTSSGRWQPRAQLKAAADGNDELISKTAAIGTTRSKTAADDSNKLKQRLMETTRPKTAAHVNDELKTSGRSQRRANLKSSGR